MSKDGQKSWLRRFERREQSHQNEDTSVYYHIVLDILWSDGCDLGFSMRTSVCPDIVA
jgi:hypothetical protein